jgi:alpha-tubulin suppressor-like RCC1 family protein
MSILLKATQRANRPRRNIVEIGATYGNVWALDKNGNIWGWGVNNLGFIGNNTLFLTQTPVKIYGNKTFCKIASGDGTGSLPTSHVLAIDKNGRAWAWGGGASGQLGDNFNTSRRIPVSVKGAIKTFCEITGGTSVSLALDKNGRAWAWGNNSAGQLGNNAIISQRTPVSVLGAIKTFCKIDAGHSHVLAIDKNGRLWGWGRNVLGELGINSTIASCLTPVSILGAVKTFCKIAVGDSMSAAIDKNGRVWCWGANSSGQLGNNTTISQRTPVSVVGAVKTFCEIKAFTMGGQGFGAFIAIDKNGKAWAWGENGYNAFGDGTVINQCTPVAVGGNVGANKTFCKIGTGFANGFAIDKNGRTWAWGDNYYHQLGAGSIVSKTTPIKLGGTLKTFCEISGNASVGASLGIDKNGKAWGWGYNDWTYNVGDNTTNNKKTPVSVYGNKTFCKIFASEHTIAIDKNGRAWGWGNNTNGQVGNNTVVGPVKTPVSVLGAVKTFCQISGGRNHVLAIDKNGRAWGWGNNALGQLGDNTITDKRTPVSVVGTIKTFCQITGSLGNDGSFALDKNGRAWAWGNNTAGSIGDNTTISRRTPVSVAGAVKTFCQISIGSNSVLAIDKNGRAWAWGSYIALGIGSETSKLSPVTILGQNKTFCKVSAGGDFSVAIDKNGRAWGWGRNDLGQLGTNSTIATNVARPGQITPVSVAGAIKTFCRITGGGQPGIGFSLAIDKNGRAWAWGNNGNGQLGDNTTVGKFTPVSVAGAVKTFCDIKNGVNQSFGIALDKNGRIWGWGINGNGQLGDNTNVSKRTPVSVLGAAKTFCKIAAGGFHTAAIDKNGRMWCWGNNSNGQLGVNSTVIVSVATPLSVVGTAKTFCHVSAGNNHTLAIDKNGLVWAWGFNNTGQLADGESADSLTPKSIIGQVKTFCKIAAGNGPSLAIDKNGRLWGWGFNGNGAVGNDTVVPPRTPVLIAGTAKTFCEVTSGNSHTLAIEKNGRVWAWGLNTNLQLANLYVTSVLTPVSVVGAIKTFCQIKCGGTHTIGLDKNGAIWGWGNDFYGQAGINQGLSYNYHSTPKRIAGISKTFCKISAGIEMSYGIEKNGNVWCWGRNDKNNLGIGGFFLDEESGLEFSSTPIRVCTI